jgi:hypothetical protein
VQTGLATRRARHHAGTWQALNGASVTVREAIRLLVRYDPSLQLVIGSRDLEDPTKYPVAEILEMADIDPDKPHFVQIN